MSELIAYIDGACSPINPGGNASYGVVIYEDDVKIKEANGFIGYGPKMSNNVGEYAALIKLLEWFVRPGYGKRHMTIRADSQLVINQMSGKWKTKQGLYIPYYLRAVELIDKHELQGLLTFEWIPRDWNTRADRLAMEAIYG